MVSWIGTKYEWQESIQGTDICNGAKPVDVRLPWCLGMMEAKHLCGKYRGKMTIITNSKMQEELFHKLEETTDVHDCVKHKTALKKIWTGFTDEEVEGQFVDVNDGTPFKNILDPMPFFPAQPDGEGGENCVSASIKSNQPYEASWYDTYCDRPLASFCRINRIPRLQIRGKDYCACDSWFNLRASLFSFHQGWIVKHLSMQNIQWECRK